MFVCVLVQQMEVVMLRFIPVNRLSCVDGVVWAWSGFI